MKRVCLVCGQPLYEKRGHCSNCGTGFNFRDQKPDNKKKKKKKHRNNSGLAQW